MKTYRFTQLSSHSFTLWNRYCKELVFKRIGLVSILFLMTIFTSSGQSTDSVPFLGPADDLQGTLQINEVEKFQKFKENTHTYKSVTLVHTADLSKFQNDKKISILLPGIKGIPIAKARKIEAYSLEDYTWKGDFENEHEGTVLLIAEEGKVFGHIRIDDKSY